jgi:3-deoxy-D-arabino-heptulosonate 7-phosphate (DAHP) synthase class II
VYNVLEKELGVNTAKNRFHAVHRVGKKFQGKRRPIIVRFVCREDRDKVWSVRGKLKESITHADAYITEDYARAIQEERKVLIKAMMKAREEHGLSEAKVKGRFLFINTQI